MIIVFIYNQNLKDPILQSLLKVVNTPKIKLTDFHYNLTFHYLTVYQSRTSGNKIKKLFYYQQI